MMPDQRLRHIRSDEISESFEELLRSISHRFEGTPDVLRHRRSRWVPYFQGCQRVLDIGCGEGIFLELLREVGIPAEGIDIDPKVVAAAQAKGLNVRQAKAQEYLSERQGVYDGIFLGHIIEHLSGEEMLRLLYDCRRALRPGGTLIVLTPNFQHPQVATFVFWLDITHQRPYPLILLEAVFSTLGLEVVEKGLESEGLDQYIVGRLPRPEQGAWGMEHGAEGKEPPSPMPYAPFVVTWHAPLFDPSGYADEARQFVLGLDTIGVSVRAVPMSWSKAKAKLPPEEQKRLEELAAIPIKAGDLNISVVHVPPRNFCKIPHAVYHIGRTMFESDRIPSGWVSACNQMDEIWVPSDFNLETFSRSGVERKKLFKIPGSIHISAYPMDAEPLPIKGRGFNFLSVFDWILRKGWDVLLRAFLEEFRPDEDVALVLKVWSSFGRTVEQLREEAESYLRSQGLASRLPPNIVFLYANLPEDQLPRLYRAVDAFVLPTRGEGWGRPFMEAMLMGLPVIGTRWSGQLEFMNEENAYLIDCQVVDVPEPAWREVPFYRGHRWAEPSVSHLRQLMRRVYEERGEARLKGRIARQQIIANFSREKVAQKIKERLEIIAQQLQRESKKVSCPVPLHPSSPVPRPSSQRLAIVWEGSQFVHHSLALVNRELCLQLIGAGHEVSVIPYESDQFGPEVDPRFRELAKRFHAPLSRPADVHVRHRWPPDFSPPPAGHWVIIQPWEFGSLPKQWVTVMNGLVDEIWVPSSYVRDCYIRSGVPAEKVHVVPNGIDPQRFRPDASPLDIPALREHGDKFKFLFVGGTIWRKGIDILLKAYLKAFTESDKVCLVIKDMGGQSFYRGQTFDREIRRAQKNLKAPPIVYLDEDLFPHQLPSLYKACHCLVHPYRGEGFGLPIAEAMACGLPVIVTGGGAALDFCHPEFACLVPAVEKRWSERRVGNWETVDYPWTLEPDTDALARWMRHFYEHPEEAYLIGQRASAYIRTHFSWSKAAEKALQRLRALREKSVLRSSQKSAALQAAPCPPRKRPLLSLCMIVKDEAENLPRCLKSVQGIVDEIIVVDTGSTDETPKIAQRYGAKVIPFEWTGSFSDARNESLKHATGEWILWLDADEALAEGKERLRVLLEESADCDGFVLPMVSFTGFRSHREGHVHPAFRLFRNLKGIRFERDLHEQITLSIRSLKPEAKFGVLPVWIEHYGYLVPIVQRKQKVQRNLDLAKKELKANPFDPFAWFNLGREYLRLQQWERAFYCLRRAMVHLGDGFTPYLLRCVCDAVHCLTQLKRHQQALALLKEAQQLPVTTPDFWKQEGHIRFGMGDFSGALRAFQSCLRFAHRLPVNYDWTEGATSYGAWYWMGMCYQKMGQLGDALQCFGEAVRTALSRHRYYEPAVTALVQLVLTQCSSMNDLMGILERFVPEDIAQHPPLMTLLAKAALSRYPLPPLAFEVAQALVGGIEATALTAALNGEAEQIFVMGKLALLQRRYQEAANLLRQVPLTAPEGVTAWNLRTLALALAGDWDEALEFCADDPIWRWLLCRWQTETLPDFDGLPKEFAPALRGNFLELLALLLQLQEFDRYEQALAFLDWLFDDEFEKAMALGKLYGQFGFWDLVIETLLPVAQHRLADRESWRLLAKACQKRGLYDEAATILLQLVQDDEAKDEALTDYLALAGAYIAQGKAEEAQQVLALAEQLNA